MPSPAEEALWAVIPVFNRKADTLACLERLHALGAEAPGLRVMIADDGSTDGTAAAVQAAFPETRFVTGRGDWWWTGGMRAGVDAALQAGATSILCMNDDTLLMPGCLGRLRALAAQAPGCLVAPQGVDAEGRVCESGYRWMGMKGWTSQHLAPGWVPTDKPYETSAVAGYAVLIPAEAFRRAGNYDAAALPHYHADLEFCVRAGRAGFKVLVDPQARLDIKPNLTNVHLLSGAVTAKRLKALFRYPGGVYHPRVLLAFYGLTHPRGRVAGWCYALYTLLKIGAQLALNALGLGARLRPRSGKPA